MIKSTFYVGHNDGDTNETISDAESVITGTLARYVDGFTLISAAGFWRGSSEPTSVVIVYGNDLPTDAIAADLARALNQQCVGVNVEPAALDFVGQDGSVA